MPPLSRGVTWRLHTDLSRASELQLRCAHSFERPAELQLHRHPPGFSLAAGHQARPPALSSEAAVGAAPKLSTQRPEPRPPASSLRADLLSFLSFFACLMRGAISLERSIASSTCLAENTPSRS